MIKNFDGSFFDFDGTIAETGEGIFNCVQIALGEAGFPPATEAQLKAFIGPPIFDSFKAITGQSDAVAEKVSEIYRKHYAETGIIQFRIYDGIFELFEKLKTEGVKLAIVSSKPENFVFKILNSIGKIDTFDYIACPKSDSQPESKAQLIERARLNLGLEKSKTVMIGDRKFDIEGAVTAGVRSIGALYGYGSREELVEAGAELLAESAAEIGNIILSDG